ncbi:MAG: DUF1684 domain-containing protein [Acidobacteria bacterium]|nr:DUF1684 domain-containing protein [Acidobacteriota bacterium]
MLFAGANAQTFYGTTDLKTFRDGRDKEFRNKDESPLKAEDFAKFKGLNNYPFDKAFRVTAVFERTADEKYFQMPTSSGTTKKFVKYGVLTFAIGGKQQRLSVYQTDAETLAKFPEYADLLFVPFRDPTNRTDTYGGGRYIDIMEPRGKTVTLDLNLAYNPNCAYGSDKYNCPIPPRENTLEVSITAGEKRYIYSGYDKTH